jgi:hypothetical protein
MKHVPYGGSSMDRTLACHGWLEQSKDLPKSPPGEAARVGSMHHMVQERCQRDEVEPENCLGIIYKEPGYNYEHEFTEDDLTLSEIAYHKTNEI